MEGKRARFVENAEELENADGMRGYLEAVGESNHHPPFYEKFVKKVLDIILSFGGFVVLSPVILIISIWILIDEPDLIFLHKRGWGKTSNTSASINSEV